MSIKGRIAKLESHRAANKEIKTFEVLCIATNRRPTETCTSAIYSCGDISHRYDRDPTETTNGFVRRVHQEGEKLAGKEYPNAIFVYGGAKYRRPRGLEAKA